MRSIREGGSPSAIVPRNPPTPTAPGVATSPTRTRRTTASVPRSTGLTSLAASYLLGGFTDLLTPEVATSSTGTASSGLNLSSKLGSALRDLTGGINALDRQVAKAARSNPERLSAKDPTGTRTLGNVSLPQLLRASQKGTLRTNQAGKVTIPATRQAARRLKSARAQVQRTTGIDGPLTAGQKRFAELVAKGTGLSPRVVAAQALGEMSGPHAVGREREGNHNWLNIGYFDSGPGALTRDPTWSTPESAAKATIDFFKGERFGPSEGIRSILPSAQGRSDQAQLAAIARSGWATNPSYGSLLASTHQQISGGQPNPVAAQRLQQAKAQATRLGIPTRPRPAQIAQRLGPPDKQTMSRFRAALTAAKELDVAQLPYVWGGGHGHPTAQPTGGGLDCSGAVSYVLNKMGAMKGSLVSGDMGQVLKPGPGAVTVFYNAGHTFMKIGNRYFGTSRRNPEGGPGFIEGSRPGDLSKYNVGHVPGLGGKVALQLGVDLGEARAAGGAGGSGGGVVYGSDGTTATVTGGSQKSDAGFSDRPIIPSVMPIETPTAARAALPDAYGEFQEGGDGADGIVEKILRGRA